MHICRNRRELHRLLPFPEKVLRVSGHTDHNPREDRPNTGEKHPAWLDDIIVVTKGSKEQHKKELIDLKTPDID